MNMEMVWTPPREHQLSAADDERDRWRQDVQRGTKTDF